MTKKNKMDLKEWTNSDVYHKDEYYDFWIAFMCLIKAEKDTDESMIALNLENARDNLWSSDRESPLSERFGFYRENHVDRMYNVID